MKPALVADLERLLGGGSVVTDPVLAAPYGRDFVMQRGTPGAVVRPAEAADVSAVLTFASRHGTPVVPRAAGSNLCGGFVPTPESILLDMTSMDRIDDVDPDARRAIVEPGVINAALQARLEPLGLRFSPDPASSAMSTIGGNIIENAGGPGCIKYGVTFHHVAEIDLAVPGGEILTLREDDAVDLLGVAIGSEGVLGVVTRAVLRLRPIPPAAWTALCAYERVEQAAETVSAIIAARIQPSALELCDDRMIEVIEAWQPSGYPLDAGAILFAELDGSPEEVAVAAGMLKPLLRQHDPDVRIAGTPDERRAMWAGRLGAGLATIATGRSQYVCDVTVPRQRIPEMTLRAREVAARHSVNLVVAAHAGDGNLHPVILYEPAQADAMAKTADEIAQAALDLGGTLTGEHGIGTEKVRHMRRRFGAPEIAAFRAIKRAFDPRGVMNPGVLLPPPATDEPDLPAFARGLSAALAGRKLGTGEAHGDARDILVDEENLTVETGAGERCDEVVARLGRLALRCPALEDSAETVGEHLASAGHRQPARGALLCVEATLADGPAVRFGSAAVKDVAGLDAKRLIAGTQGAFGRIERAIFRVTPLHG